jgi:hypothetical protein
MNICFFFFSNQRHKQAIQCQYTRGNNSLLIHTSNVENVENFMICRMILDCIYRMGTIVEYFTKSMLGIKFYNKSFIIDMNTCLSIQI